MSGKPATSPAEAKAALERMQRDPLFVVSEVLGCFPWSKQREIIESIRDNPRTAVRSCHGVGKTYTAAIAVVTFLLTHPHSRVITTAPTWYQVEFLLWQEIRRVVGDSKTPLGIVPLTTQIKIAEGWFAIGLSTDRPERFAGQHARYVLVVIDEGSGVDDAIFESAEGYFTAGGNEGTIARLLTISNPTRITGQFARAFKTNRARWNTISISAFDSPAVTIRPRGAGDKPLTEKQLREIGVDPAKYAAIGQHFTKKKPAEIEDVPASVRRMLVGDVWVLDKALGYGISSPLWNIRVLGDFPDQNENSVVRVGGIEAAIARSLDPRPDAERVVAVDVARYGDDESVIASRADKRIRLEEVFSGQATTSTAGRALNVAVDLRDDQRAALELEEGKPLPKPVRIVIDTIGVGAGVFDSIVESIAADPERFADIVAEEFMSSSSPIESEEYPNARSESWFRFADMVDELDLDDDDTLAADLVAPEYTIDSRGRRVVEPKEKTKKRLKRSPDRADAVLMTLIPAGGGIGLDFA